MATNSSLPLKSPNSSTELEPFYHDMQAHTLNIIILFLAGVGIGLFGLGLQNLQHGWYRVVGTGLFIVVLSALTVTRGGGLSVSQIMACVEAMTAILAPDAAAGQAEN